MGKILAYAGLMTNSVIRIAGFVTSSAEEHSQRQRNPQRPPSRPYCNPTDT